MTPTAKRTTLIIFIIFFYDAELCQNIYIPCNNHSQFCYNPHTERCDGIFQCPEKEDEIGCKKCKSNLEVPCNNHDASCYKLSTDLCDGVFQCPRGEDELKCSKRCPGKLECRDRSGCFNMNQTCDGNFDCIDKSDEMNCTYKFCGNPPKGRRYFLCINKKCIDKELEQNGLDDCEDGSDEMRDHSSTVHTLTVFLTVCLTTLFFTLICRWCTTRRDIAGVMENLPVFPLPPFRGPGDSNYITYNLYSQSDFINGGSIFEAFVQSRHRLHTESMRRSSCPIVQDQLCLFKNYNPTCAAAALASLGISSDTCVSVSRRGIFECNRCNYCQRVNMLAILNRNSSRSGKTTKENKIDTNNDFDQHGKTHVTDKP